MTSDRSPTTERPPNCPICTRLMEYCDPSHEKAYWACSRDHDPRGVVHLAKEVDDSFKVARNRIYDTFEELGVEPFEAVETPDDVAGLVSGFAIEEIESWTEFKRMRQRRGHDELDSDDREVAEGQAGLGQWSG